MICREISWRSPYAAFAPFVGMPHAHMLHGGDLSMVSQWSVIAAFPKDVLELKNDDVERWLNKVQSVLNARALSDQEDDGLSPFQSGLVGFIGYESLGSLEPSLELPKSPYVFPNAIFGVYDALVVFSRHHHKAWIVGRCETACTQLENNLGDDELVPTVQPKFSKIASNFSRLEYIHQIEQTIEKIRAGDLYQANIAQKLNAISDAEFSGFDLFRHVGAQSDASFGAFLQYEHGTILSNSPERFFKTFKNDVGERCIQVEPIKGTRPRADDVEHDIHLAQSLKDDAKERAENIMIADLMRNDLSKICDDSSINEDAICELMTLTRVHHLVSRISGLLRDEVTMVDILRALFPSGSITGAPKMEAMQVIAETEKTGRGPYCGAIGYMDDRGGTDFSVSIRTMMIEDNRCRLSIPVGGGITIRSMPEDEYEETLVKARSATSGIINAETKIS